MVFVLVGGVVLFAFHLLVFFFVVVVCLFVLYSFCLLLFACSFSAFFFL